VRAILKRVNVERKKEIKLLSLFTEIQEVQIKGHTATANARIHCERVFYYNLFSKVWQENNGIVQNLPFDKLCGQPNALLEAYLTLTAKLETIPQLQSTPKLAGELVYGFLTRHFNFERFRKLKPNLIKLDQQLHDAIRDPTQIIDKLFRPGSTAGRSFDKVGWIRRQLTTLKVRSDLLAFVRNASVESSPMLKVRFLMDGLTAVRAFLIRNCPPAEEIGADEFTPALVCYVVIAQPHAMVSNFAFLGDFCGDRRYLHLESDLIFPLRFKCFLPISA
jgi:hypothetical protein